MTKAPGEKEWISAAAAGRILGLDLRTFRKRSNRWDIRQQVLPGVPARYCRADVERLAQEAVMTTRSA